MRRSHTIFFVMLCCCILAVPFMAAASEPMPLRLEVYPPAMAVSIPETAGDGTAFLCSFKDPSLSLTSVTVTFLGRTVSAPADSNGEALVLVPIPLDQAAATAPLTWKAFFSAPPGAYAMPGGGKTTVKIRKRTYPVQKLTVEPKYVTPDPALKERIDQERKLMSAALTTRSDVRQWSLPLARPVPGKITSLYGLRRVLNGQPRSAHRGLDFRGAAGSPITAVAGGTVVLTGDFYYAGNFVVIDHGLGVVSISMHMSEIIVKQGQTVAPGERIGLVGSTGRSTGPHLHFGLSVLGQSIDALPLLHMTEEDKAVYATTMKKRRQGATPRAPQPQKAKPGPRQVKQ